MTGPTDFYAPAVYTPQPLAQPASVVPAAASVATVVLPNGQTVTGYLPTQHAAPQAVIVQPARRAEPMHPAVKNAIGGAGAFALTALGLHLLVGMVQALAQLAQTLIVLAAVVYGAPVVLALLRGRSDDSGRQQNVIHAPNARRVIVRKMINRY